jgi:small redox-active disulfide protein 2
MAVDHASAHPRDVEFQHVCVARDWFPMADSRQETRMDIKVLGTGCANCRNTIALIEQVARAKGVTVNVQKVEAMRDIVNYGVLSTPGVVIDGQVVHAGGVPGRDRVEQWLTAPRA